MTVVTGWLMITLLVVNTLSTALYTMVNKVCQDVYGNGNSIFQTLAASVIEFSIGTVVFLALLFRDRQRGVAAGDDAMSGEDGSCLQWSYMRSMLIIAFCCAVSNFIWAITGVQIKSSLQGILGLLLIPCTYVLTVLLLKRHLPGWCLAGAILVVGGTFIGSFSTVSDDSGSTSSTALTLFLCVAFSAAANVPYAYQYIVTERFFIKGYGLWALEVSSGWMEVALGVLLAPLQPAFLRLLGENPEPFSLQSGLDCMLGKDIKCRSDGHGGLHPEWYPALILVFSGIAGVLNDVAYLLLTKYGSAVYMSVADGFSASLIGVAVTFGFMGQYKEKTNVMIFVSCFICTLGMIAWAKGEEQVATEQKEARSDYTQLDSHDVKELTVPIQESPVSRNSSDEFDEQDSLNLERVHRR